MQIVTTPHAPAAVGPYSQATKAGNMVFLSGQIPLDPQSGELILGDITAQATRVLENLKAVCEATGGNLQNVVKCTVFMVDLAHFQAMNTVYAQYFKEHKPARSTIQVAALPKGAQVEIEAIMVI
ncbi:MAG TPA: RidA family protein [Turneriella sp.]|nr:RidA family protein [Turneriella sp.]